eukprot:6732545-Prymnesium_polylepis.1
MVGEAALVGVRQFYHVVEGSRDRGSGGEAAAKRHEVVRLLDEISFHQALVFCNQVGRLKPRAARSPSSSQPRARHPSQHVPHSTRRTPPPPHCVPRRSQHEQAEELTCLLASSGLPAAFISGDHAHEERCALMLRMRRFDLRVL